MEIVKIPRNGAIESIDLRFSSSSSRFFAVDVCKGAQTMASYIAPSLLRAAVTSCATNRSVPFPSKPYTLPTRPISELLTRARVNPRQADGLRPVMLPPSTRGVAGQAPLSLENNNWKDDSFTMGHVHVQGAPAGPLSGLSMVIKDSYDIAGYRTSNGSPTWSETHSPATVTASAVRCLLDAGATIVGKAIMDGMAYSLSGENAHYGVPINPVCPGRVCGGSSSGCAAAVAAGHVDFALGGDTGGSVRIPASHCGLYGMRPTHGRVSLVGSCSLAPSFDTAGWFARDPSVLKVVGTVVLSQNNQDHNTNDNNFKNRHIVDEKKAITRWRWLVAEDAFELVDNATATAIREKMSKHLEALLETGLTPPTDIRIGKLSQANSNEEGTMSSCLWGLQAWSAVFRTCQGYEAWREHGPWILEFKPALGPGVKERFAAASEVTEAQFKTSIEARNRIGYHVDGVLGEDGVLWMPTAPGPAPRIGAAAAEVDDFRARLLSLTCIAGLAGLPEVTLPIGRVEGCPVGLSLLGPRGSDEELLKLAERVAKALGLV